LALVSVALADHSVIFRDLNKAREECVRDPRNCVLNATKHNCNNSNPCQITIAASFTNWDYIDFDPLKQNATMEVAISNGKGQIMIGPQVQKVFTGCCGGRDCSADGITSYRYPGCPGSGPGTVSFWNHNAVSPEVWKFTFNGGSGTGPA